MSGAAVILVGLFMGAVKVLFIHRVRKDILPGTDGESDLPLSVVNGCL